MRLIRLAAAALIAAAVLTAPAPAHAIPPEVAGFAWANQPANPAYFLATGYEYSSVAQPIHVTRIGIGIYQVKFFGLAGNGGVAHAGAYGGTALCAVSSWAPSGADQNINVHCFNNAGVHVDSRFTVNFTNRKPAATRFAYLWNDNATPGPAGHTPAPAYFFDGTGAPAKIYRSAAGHYQVDLGAYKADSPLLWATGYLHVTPYGAAARHCQVFDPAWAADPSLIDVVCYNDFGVATDTRFTLTYARGIAALGGSGARMTATVDLAVLPPTMRGWANSLGGAPTASEVVPGSTYEVVIPNAAHAKGHAIASIMGTPPMYCVIESWWPAGADEHLLISCHDGNNGAPNPAIMLNVAYLA